MKTLSNIFTVTSASPNTEGMNAITAWMLTCIFFVFGALGGYAFLLWRKKKSCLKRHRKVKITDEEAKTRLKKKEEHRSRVDDFFLVFFPGLCLVTHSWDLFSNLFSPILQLIFSKFCLFYFFCLIKSRSNCQISQQRHL